MVAFKNKRRGGTCVPCCAATGITVSCCFSSLPATLTLGTPRGPLQLVYNGAAALFPGWFGCLSWEVPGTIATFPCDTSALVTGSVYYRLRCAGGSTVAGWRLGWASRSCDSPGPYYGYPTHWQCEVTADFNPESAASLGEQTPLAGSTCAPLSLNFLLGNVGPSAHVWGTVDNGSFSVYHTVTP